MFSYINTSTQIRQFYRTMLCLGLVWLAPGVQTHALDFNTSDTVSIVADNAWEGDDVDVIHFEGNFELRAPDWYMSADTATVYGKLDNPDKVVLEGKPAKIYFLRDTGPNTEPGTEPGTEKNEQSGQTTLPATRSEPDLDDVEGSALLIEYMRGSNKLKMTGSASLKRKDNQLSSEVIEYDIDADRYSASGDGGINIQVVPSDD
jgi:lipopolysaccharide export system protein LptA